MSARRIPRNIQKHVSNIDDLQSKLGQPEPSPAAEPEPTPSSEPTPEPAPTPEPQPSSQPEPADTTDWRQKFLTLQGVLRAEQEKHQGDLRTRDDQLKTLTGQVQQLQTQIDNGRDPTEGLKLTDFFSQEQIDFDGEDKLRSILKAAMRANGPQIKQAIDAATAPLRQELEQTRNTVAQAQQTQAETEYGAFLQTLGNQVGNWKQVNDDPRFHDYLAGTDEATGFSRQQILSNAEQRRDAARVANVFKGFLKSIGAHGAPRDPNNRILPEGSPGGGEPPLDTRPAVTEAEIRQFQADVARGKYRGRDEEKRAKQKQIDDAYMAGRVR